MLLDVGTNTPHYGLKLQAAFIPVFGFVFDLEGRICHKTVQNDCFFSFDARPLKDGKTI